MKSHLYLFFGKKKKKKKKKKNPYKSGNIAALDFFVSIFKISGNLVSYFLEMMTTSPALYILEIIYACSTANVISIFVNEDHMLDWHSCQICYRLEIKILFL